MKSCILSVLVALLTVSSHAAAADAGAHVHGAATADVVVDGPVLQIELASPLENLVGFEHAPRNARQKKAVQEMTERFARPETLFVPNADARCKAEPAAIESPLHQNGRREKRAKDAHAELHATITFRCAAPAALKAIDFRIFEVFRGIERLSVQVAGPGGQSAATLTPKRRTLSW
jgi:hypothetical protein